MAQKMLGSWSRQFSYQLNTRSVLSQQKNDKKDNLRSCCDKIAVFVDSYKRSLINHLEFCNKKEILLTTIKKE
jgi:hypothetical protein